MPTAAAMNVVTMKTTTPLRPMSPSVLGVRPPTDLMMVQRTNTEMFIWIRRKKMSPMNWTFFMGSPTTTPTITAATIEISRRMVISGPFFLAFTSVVAIIRTFLLNVTR